MKIPHFRHTPAHTHTHTSAAGVRVSGHVSFIHTADKSHRGVVAFVGGKKLYKAMAAMLMEATGMQYIAQEAGEYILKVFAGFCVCIYFHTVDWQGAGKISSILRQVSTTRAALTV